MHATGTLRAVLVGATLIVSACQQSAFRPVSPEQKLISRGRDIFFNETFDGNGRTCGTCHRAERNFTIDPAFISTLPADDPLFVAERNPDLARLERPVLLRAAGLILENQDGFPDGPDDPAGDANFNARGVPHVLGLRHSVNSGGSALIGQEGGPRTGWGGDGSPGDGSLRSFATGAVVQHFTKTLNREVGRDFRLPTEEELDALEAFQLSLGRQEELELPLPLRGAVARRGQQIFLDGSSGKCAGCHMNAGANADPNIFGASAGNLNFNTGVEAMTDTPADQTGELVPPDDGFGTPGNGEFNTPSLVEAADTGPFFHDNSMLTVEGAIAFYNSNAFNNSPAGQLLLAATGSGINLEPTQVEAVAVFLRVINALQNIGDSLELLGEPSRESLRLAVHETDDGIRVLEAVGVHAAAVVHLRNARRLTEKAIDSFFFRKRFVRKAMEEQKLARASSSTRRPPPRRWPAPPRPAGAPSGGSSRRHRFRITDG